ncbi:MAG: G8 domain-containing protein, partial [Patescibacteria group bacterium]
MLRRSLSIAFGFLSLLLLGMLSLQFRNQIVQAQSGGEPAVIQTHDKIPNPCGLQPVTKTAIEGNWSAASSWNPSGVPDSTDVVMVPAGATVTVDSTAATAKDLCIHGTVAFATNASTRIIVRTIFVYGDGTLRVGERGAPIAPAVTAEIVFADVPLNTALDPSQYWNGLLALGKVTMHGAAMNETFVQLDRDVAAGATLIPLVRAVTGWKAGDAVVFHGTRQLSKDDVDQWGNAKG